MPKPTRSRSRARRPAASRTQPECPRPSAAAALAALRSLASRKVRDGMARFGIPDDHALGVPVGRIRALAKDLGRDHVLAEELWATGVYEARMLAAFVAEPDRLTPAQMDAWCRDFDSWAIVDTACFHLFDKTPHAFGRIAAWAKRRAEFERRAAFALLASVALHDREAADAAFVRALPAIERAAADGRNFVKKGVSWALRSIGHRSRALHAAAVELARRLASSAEPATRWVGNDALRDLRRPAVLRKFR